MKLTLRVWRQRNADAEGAMSTYELDGISCDMSFLEMLDTLNEELILKGEDPVAFDHDCREGICGACSLVINGEAFLAQHVGDLEHEHRRRGQRHRGRRVGAGRFRRWRSGQHHQRLALTQGT